MMNKMNRLTLKQEKFCQKVVELGNVSDAYRESYNAGKMKPETINSKAYLLSNKDYIRARIVFLQEEAKKRNDVTVDRLIQELKTISFFDPFDLFDENGNLKEVKDMPETVRRAISEIKIEELIIDKKSTKVKTTVKMHSKLDSIDKLAKHIGFYLKDNEQRGKSAAEAFMELMQQASAKD